MLRSHEPQVAQGIMMPGLNFPGTPTHPESQIQRQTAKK
jgi:hypothetical protein